ncbi:MAG: hypothetical protein ACYTG4_05600, partial [Planctomycetota bacterium]
MNTRSLIRGLGAAIVIAALATPAWAAKLVVGQGDYPTIQSAVDAANPGDVILVPAGTWEEGVDVIGKSDLRIIGKGARIRSGGEDYGFELDGCSNITIQGFFIDSSGERGGMRVDDSEGTTISKMEIDGGVAQGIQIRQSPGT